ncbi:unnamed protein product [Lampetra planeri]
MSKHLKKKNPPAPSSNDEDDSLPQDLPATGAADLVTATAAGSTKVSGKDVGAGPSISLATDDGWRQVAEQIESLRAVLLNLVTLVAASAAPGWPQETLPSGDVQGSFPGISEGLLVQESAAIAASGGLPAIMSTVAATCRKAAIMGTAAQLESAISSEPRGARPTVTTSTSAGTGRRRGAILMEKWY